MHPKLQQSLGRTMLGQFDLSSVVDSLFIRNFRNGPSSLPIFSDQSMPVVKSSITNLTSKVMVVPYVRFKKGFLNPFLLNYFNLIPGMSSIRIIRQGWEATGHSLVLMDAHYEQPSEYGMFRMNIHRPVYWVGFVENKEADAYLQGELYRIAA